MRNQLIALNQVLHKAEKKQRLEDTGRGEEKHENMEKRRAGRRTREREEG